MSFIFGDGTDLTYEQMMQRRQMAEALQKRAGGRITRWGEGLESAANSIAGGLMQRSANKADEQLGEEWESSYDDFLGGFTGGGSPSFVGGGAGGAPSRNEAMAANGGPTQAAADAMAGGGTSQGPTQSRPGGDKGAFIAEMMPHAMRVSQQTGLDPRLVIAQAAQETGWGRSAPNNNYFGIKSHGKPGGGSFATTEYVNGRPVTINDSFRGYGGMGESADGYAQFLQENPRYREMLSSPDLDSQLAALGQSGYATDPNYAQSVGSIARSIPLADSGGSFAPSGSYDVADASGSIGKVAKAMELLNSPYAKRNPGRAKVLEQIVAREMQKSDPMYQMDLQLRQAQLEAARQPGERAIREDQNGVARYVDTGEPVFAGVESTSDRTRTLSPTEVVALGFPEGSIVQESADGALSIVQDGQTQQFDPDRYRVVGGSLFDLGAEGGPQAVGQGQMQERTIFGADGQPILIEGGPGSGTKFTEGQSKDNVYATRARGALEVLDSVDSNVLADRGMRMADAVPFGLARGMQSDDFQVADQAGTEFLQAILRKDTGAAITQEETDSYGRTYLPFPGDGPAVVEAKREARIRAINAIESGMNPAQMMARDRALIMSAREADGVDPRTGAPVGGGAQMPDNSDLSNGMTREQYISDPVNQRAAQAAGVTVEEMWEAISQ